MRDHRRVAGAGCTRTVIEREGTPTSCDHSFKSYGIGVEVAKRRAAAAISSDARKNGVTVAFSRWDGSATGIGSAAKSSIDVRWTLARKS